MLRICTGPLRPLATGPSTWESSRLSTRIASPGECLLVISKPSEQREDLVKRVIGLPHETVEMRDGKVFINGMGLDESAYIENLGNFSMPPLVLGTDAYFVLGDNRRESEDSRRFGPVPARTIIGKVWFIYWPLDVFGLFPEQAPSREPLPVRTGEVPARPPGELFAAASG